MEAGVVLQMQDDSMWHVALCYCLRWFEVSALHSLSDIVVIFISRDREKYVFYSDSHFKYITIFTH